MEGQSRGLEVSTGLDSSEDVAVLLEAEDTMTQPAPKSECLARKSLSSHEVKNSGRRRSMRFSIARV